MQKLIKLSVLRVLRVVGVFRVFRFFRRSNVLILCYHGGSIGDENRFNPLLFSSREFFQSRLRWLLKKEFTIVSLDEAIDISQGAKGPKLPTVPTFDDGWHSTYSSFGTVMRESKVPATLYLCTRYFVEARPNIEVAVSYVIWKADRQIVSFSGPCAALDGRFDLSSDSERRRLASAAFAWIELHSLTREEVCAALEEFAAQLGVTADELNLRSKRFDFLSLGELLELSKEGWSIQLHGHNHRYPVGEPSELAEDLLECRRVIRHVGLPESRHYCYPSGQFDAFAPDCLRDIGVVSAVTCDPGIVRVRNETDAYFLPRFLDGAKVSDLEFQAEMSGVLDFVRRVRNSVRLGFSSRETAQ